jgi:hypothetical protein
LVCCDGCPRSFHFNCVDPPMIEDLLPDSWFCRVCVSKREMPLPPAQGIFKKLSTILVGSNPRAFLLPKTIRNYFENVRTGPEGEYEDGVVVTSKVK